MAVSLRPDPAAAELAQVMTAETARPVMRTILEETLRAAQETGTILESGRTVCNDLENVREPINRFPTAVDLAGCPVGAQMGIWHTHVTPDELENPTHSLPDYANAVFGIVDASVVAGTESAHVLVRPEQRRAGVEVFQQAMGVDVEGPEHVVDVVQGWDDERRRDVQVAVDEALAPLADRVRTGFPQLDATIDEAAAPDVAAAAPCGCMGYADGEDATPAATDVLEDVDDRPAPAQIGPPVTGGGVHPFRARPRECSVPAFQGNGIDIGGIVIGTVIGNIAGRVTDRIIFGESA